MIRSALVAIALVSSSLLPAFAQESGGLTPGVVVEPLLPLPPGGDGVTLRTFDRDIVQETVVEAVSAPGAFLRGLDKLNGTVADFELANGASFVFRDMRVDLGECRYPEDNPTGEAFAFVTVHDTKTPDAPVFSGWMIASSPALSAMDHARYDIWVLRCKTPPAEETSGDE